MLTEMKGKRKGGKEEGWEGGVGRREKRREEGGIPVMDMDLKGYKL